MAVLMLIVVLLARVFGSASTAWRSGNKRIESNNTGRAALDFMAQELSGLVVGPNGPTMLLDSDATDYLGMKSDVLSFVSMNHIAEYRPATTNPAGASYWVSGNKYRDVQQIRYQVVPMSGFTNRYALTRFVVEQFDDSLNNHDKFSSYWNSDWPNEPSMLGQISFGGNTLAENIRNFEVFITPVGALDPQEDYDYLQHGPPAVIDIYLEVLAEEDAVRASLTPGNQQFLDAATRRYATRIFVQNRSGYADF